MKIFRLIPFFFPAAVVLSSCSDPFGPGLSGKVYQSSDGMDSACNHVPKATDYFQTLLFINDSEFVHLVNTCCSSPGEDFAYQYVSKGTYKLNATTLDLAFDSVTAVCYIKESVDPSGANSSSSTERIELEMIEPFTDKLERLSCMEAVYFKQVEGEFKDEFVAPTGDSIGKYVNELREIGAWKELFPEEKPVQ